MCALERESMAILAELAARVRALKVGDPRERTTQVGPLARADLVEELDSQVRRSVAAGARVLAGGSRRPGHPRAGANDPRRIAPRNPS